LYRMFIADTDSENIKILSGFLAQKHDIVPDVWLNRFRYLKFLEESESAIVFIRVDNCAVAGLELTQEAISRGAGIHVVWMASSGAYAVDAFRYGAEAYLLLPVIEETLSETIYSINNRTKGN
jgi:two-component SAPR family response regulator